MDHKRIHDAIIDRARQRGWTRKSAPVYVESHHIIPRCVGGLRLRNNLVCLTAKEHYLVHLLLTKIYTEPHQKKSIYAAYLCMAGVYSGIVGKRSSRMYSEFRKYVSEANSGENNPMWGKTTSQKQKDAVRNYRLGIKESEETRQKKRLVNLGRKHKEESNEKNRQWHLGKKQSEESINKKVDSVSRKWLVTFPDGHSEEVKNLAAFQRQYGIKNLHTKPIKGYKAVKLTS